MIVKEQDYLEWHGRLGMRWYQHIFGRVQTGAKYYKNGNKAKDKAETKAIKQERNKTVNPRKKALTPTQKASKMTDAELRKATDRLQAEKKYVDAVKALNKEKREESSKVIKTGKVVVKAGKYVAPAIAARRAPDIARFIALEILKRKKGKHDV